MAFLTTLRQAFTVSYLLVASLPVLLFGLISIQLISDHQLKGVQERNMRQTHNIVEEVDTFLREVRSDLLHVKHVIDSGAILQPDSIDQFLSGVVANSQFFESIYYLDKAHRVTNLGLLASIEMRRSDYFGLDYSGHQVFEELSPQQESVWSNTYVSLITGEPSVSLGLKTNEGFLLGNIQLKSLGVLLQRYEVYGEAEVAIIDLNGTLIAHSVKEKAMQRINFGNHPVVSKAMAGTESTNEFREGDSYYLESAAEIETAKWVVLVGLDMRQILAPIQNMEEILIAFMVVTAIIASILSLFNIRRLMLPLTSLGEKAGMIADGRYDFDHKPSGFSEIDNLAGQIANMSKAIKVREKSIIANERRFRDLVNSIDGIVWEMDYPSFRFLFVSQQAESILGYPLQGWYENPNFWESKVHDDDRGQAKAYCQLMSEKQEDHDFEYRMIAADGRIVWIRDLVTVVVEGNRPVRLLGVMIDITEQKMLLNELSRSEENYREIFNSTSDAIFIHHAETGEVLDVNQAMLDMFKCSYQDALSGGIVKYSLGESPYSVSEAMEKLQIAKTEGTCLFEWRARKETGEVFWAEVYLRSAVIGGGKRILAAVRDVTHRKAAEEELAQYRSNLEELVLQRTKQLEHAQQQLVQKERLAVLGQLTATVSHEIRNPLGTVANSLYLLKEALSGKGHEALQRPLQLAERNVERCDSIISDLLDFSRQRDVEKLPLQLDNWLREFLGEIRIPQNVELNCDFKANCSVPADEERIRRVMVNVVTNALQALEEVENEHKRLDIATELVDGCCLIEVVDNGPGMSEDILQKIYEPMFSTKNFGVGLGVPIIKSIIESHGGQVRYKSTEGEGTTVSLWLPLEQMSVQ